MLSKMRISKFLLDVLGEMLGMGRVLVPLQSLWTIKNDTSLFNFQSSERFPKFLRQKKAISKYLSDVIQENKRCQRGGWSNLILIIVNLKNGARTSNYQSIEPRPRSIRSSFMYIPYMLPGNNLQPLP